MKKKQLALTLVEVLVVLFILGLLAALMLPATQSARHAAARRNDPADKYEAIEFALFSKESTDAPAASAAPAGEAKGEQVEAPAATPMAVDRKIVYAANINLVVEDFGGMNEKVLDLVKQYDGYVADSSVEGTSGASRHATWRIRVPVARFDAFVAAAQKLGELVGVTTTSQDMTEEYVDVEARIRNKAKEEQRLLELLEERPGKLEDVIAIERELSRAREELERMQGRMRVLEDQTSLTSVRLTIAEFHSYLPAEAPSLLIRIRRTFDESLAALQVAGTASLLAVVALTPWLVTLGVLGGVTYFFLRPWLRKLDWRKNSTT